MKAKTNSHHKNRRPTITFLNKFLVLYVLVLVAFLSGCYTTASNIKSVDELKGNKLLVGRFVFYVNDKLVNLRVLTKEDGNKKTVSGFTILVKKGDEKPKKIELDEKGYIYIPVDAGQYYLTRINTNTTLFFGARYFHLRSSTGINVNPSDALVNFGTIKVEYKRSVASKAAGLLFPLLF